MNALTKISEIPGNRPGGGPTGDGGQQAWVVRHCAHVGLDKDHHNTLPWCAGTAGTASAESVEGRLFGSQGVEGPHMDFA